MEAISPFGQVSFQVKRPTSTETPLSGLSFFVSFARLFCFFHCVLFCLRSGFGLLGSFVLLLVLSFVFCCSPLVFVWEIFFFKGSNSHWNLSDSSLTLTHLRHKRVPAHEPFAILPQHDGPEPLLHFHRYSSSSLECGCWRKTHST